MRVLRGARVREVVQGRVLRASARHLEKNVPRHTDRRQRGDGQHLRLVRESVLQEAPPRRALGVLLQGAMEHPSQRDPREGGAALGAQRGVLRALLGRRGGHDDVDHPSERASSEGARERVHVRFPQARQPRLRGLRRRHRAGARRLASRVQHTQRARPGEHDPLLRGLRPRHPSDRHGVHRRGGAVGQPLHIELHP